METPDLSGGTAPPVQRLTWRIDDIVRALGISRRTFERERSAGRIPPPDLHVGKMPLWKPATIQAWIDAAGKLHTVEAARDALRADLARRLRERGEALR
jgi:predicted site-specific integrase-resolvase